MKGRRATACGCEQHRNKTLDGFVTKSSWKLFRILDVPDSFLEMDQEIWNESENLEIDRGVICSHTTTNDRAEKVVAKALMQQLIQLGRFKNE